MDREELFDKILKEWTQCNEVCDLAVPKKGKDYGLDRVDEYMNKLPGATYVRTQMLNYIFSNGLTTGSINEDVKLEEFLYRNNERENLNLDEIRNAIGAAITHGCSGLRWMGGNVYEYKWGEYRALTYLSASGIRKNIGYVVAQDGGQVPAFEFESESYKEYRDLIRDLSNKGLILLSNSEFRPIRNDTSYVYGRSPLLDDTERLDLMLATYERLNYDIRYDGPGRIIIRPKDGYVNGENEVSSSTVVSESLTSTNKRIEAVKQEAQRVANQIKNSSSDSVIVLSNAFDKDIEHLERVTKATEFFTWLKNDTMILAQDFGMNPSLLELGGISGNVSMTSILDSAMLNSIVPLRERYATQFSSFLASHLKLTKVYFNKYEMQQQEDENTMRTKIVNIMSLLNAMRDENDVIRPNALNLFDDFASMLSANVHNENNQLEELSAGLRTEEIIKLSN